MSQSDPKRTVQALVRIWLKEGKVGWLPGCSLAPTKLGAIFVLFGAPTWRETCANIEPAKPVAGVRKISLKLDPNLVNVLREHRTDIVECPKAAIHTHLSKPSVAYDKYPSSRRN
jgi:hypothetical protein